MKKKILSAIFMLCAGVCLGLGLTACGEKEEADPIKYAQSVLENYGTDYDYVYTYVAGKQDGDEFVVGWDIVCYVSIDENKTTLARTQYIPDSDTKGTSVIDYFEFVPSGENVTVFEFDIDGLTYTTQVLTQKAFVAAYPYLIENAFNAFVNFDPDNFGKFGFESEDPYFAIEDSRVLEKKVSDDIITLTNTCQYNVGAIPTEEDRDKYNPNPDSAYKGTHILGPTIQINKKTKQIISLTGTYTENPYIDVEYSYNLGTRAVNTKHFGTTKKEAASKILQDMTIEQFAGNYKMEGSIQNESGTNSIETTYDAEKGMTKTVSDDGVVYQKFEFNEDATENETYAIVTSYTEKDHLKTQETYTREQYAALSGSVYVLYALPQSLDVNLQDYSEEDIEIEHDVEENTTVVTLTNSGNTTTITFKSENDFEVKSQANGATFDFQYSNHLLTKTVIEIEAMFRPGVKTTMEVTYSYDNVESFEFDESLFADSNTQE